MSDVKNRGGKREGSGRKKYELPQKTVAVANDLRELIKQINEDYQRTNDLGRQQIIEALEAIT